MVAKANRHLGVFTLTPNSNSRGGGHEARAGRDTDGGACAGAGPRPRGRSRNSRGVRASTVFARGARVWGVSTPAAPLSMPTPSARWQRWNNSSLAEPGPFGPSQDGSPALPRCECCPPDRSCRPPDCSRRLPGRGSALQNLYCRVRKPWTVLQNVSCPLQSRGKAFQES